VSDAIRKRLVRARGNLKHSLSERLLAIGRDCAAHLKEPYKSMDIDELLYGEKGLPD
jgi:antitoxin VapB